MIPRQKKISDDEYILVLISVLVSIFFRNKLQENHYNISIERMALHEISFATNRMDQERLVVKLNARMLIHLC